MKKYMKIIFLTAAFSFVLTSAIYAETKDSHNSLISSEFDKIKSKISDEQKVKNSVTLAEGKGINITADDFKLYKANLEFIAHMNNIPFKYSNQDIIMMMAKEQLVVQYAKDHGISVSKQEINDFIKQTRDQLKSNPEISEVMKNRIRISGLNEEQFYASKKIQEAYENLLYNTKVADFLQNQGNLKNPLQDFGKFQEDLWNQNKNLVQIDQDDLNKL